jgi:hypothetical protein
VLTFDWPLKQAKLPNVGRDLTPHRLEPMASPEVQQALPTNGHIHPADDQANSHSCDVGREDTMDASPVEPTARPGQDIPATGLEEAATAQHEQLRSGVAQPEEAAASPVLDKPPVVQSAASSKQKPTTSLTKRPPPTVQTTTTKGASGPPTPQVKKVFTHFFLLYDVDAALAF